MKDWEVIIGLEIHAELNTKSKLFSTAFNRFGDEPNTNITEVCTGQPGALPVLNKEAVKKAIQFGCAIEGNVKTFSKFDRKSYFYPDSPRNFQITQYDEPIIEGGIVIAEVEGEEKSFSVNRVHLEDDAGMLKHFPSFAGVDYNRAGVPLIEIVSEPCIHSPKEAVAYATQVKAILEYIDASDCNMEEGSLRIDANISVRKHGEKGFRNKIEIKNMNSFSNMELALQSEIKRQVREYTENPEKDPKVVITQATYRFDPEKKETILMRRKEDAEDYRYFPEPDLPPILLKISDIEEIRKTLPELPLQRERRYVRELNLSPHHAFLITSDKATADYFEEVLSETSNAKAACNWIIEEFGGRLKGKGVTLPKSGILSHHIAKLVEMIDEKTITRRMAKEIADEMVLHPGRAPDQIVEENVSYRPVHDHSEIEPLVDKVIQENGQSVSDYLSGREKALAFLVGQVMKLSQGKASPEVVNHLLQDKIKAFKS